jgi:FkbM family methyltransferase
MTESVFSHEYDLNALHLAKPLGHEFSMYVTPRYRDHYERKQYEPHSASLVSSLAKRMALFVDVGANYGFYSLLAANANPSLEIISLEPVPVTCDILRRNVVLNELHQVSVQQYAVSNSIGTREFKVSLASDSSGFFDHPNVGTLETIEVNTVTIDSILAHRAPCPLLLKIDTEGNELAVLDGMTNTLKRFNDIRMILEFCPDVLWSAKTRPKHLIEKLEELDFAVFLIDETAGKIIPYNDFFEGGALFGQNYANLYCVRKSRALNLCFFIHSAGLAGSERVLLELVEDMIIDHDAVCTVVLPQAGPLQSKLRSMGAATLVVPFAWWVKRPGRTDDEIKEILGKSARNLISKALPTLRQIAPDVIWTQTMVIPWGSIVAEELGKPHVWYVTEFGAKDHGFTFIEPLSELTKSISLASDLLYTCSNAVAAELFSENKSVQTLYCIPKISTTPSVVSKNFFHNQENFKISMLGTVCQNKGQADILRAVAYLLRQGMRVELVFAGMEFVSYRKHLDDFIAEQGISASVRFMGMLDDPSELIAASDVLVSCSRFEAFGRTPVEAMLLGKPIIVPNLGGGREYIREGENALSYTPGNIRELVACLQKFITDRELLTNMGARGRVFAESFFVKEIFSGKVASALRALVSSGEVRSAAPEVIRPFFGRI